MKTLLSLMKIVITIPYPKEKCNETEEKSFGKEK
jgi:hypothetical protein